MSVTRTVVKQQYELYAGPLPHPEIMERYDQIVPGSAAKIVDVFVRQADHRMSLEKAVIRSDMYRSWTGLALGFLITTGAIGAGAYLTLQGHSVPGGLLSLTALAALASVFVHGSQMRRSERQSRLKHR